MEWAIIVSVISAVGTVAVTFGKMASVTEELKKNVVDLHGRLTSAEAMGGLVAVLEERSKAMMREIVTLEANKATVGTVEALKEGLTRIDQKLDNLLSMILNNVNKKQ